MAAVALLIPTRGSGKVAGALNMHKTYAFDEHTERVCVFRVPRSSYYAVGEGAKKIHARRGRFRGMSSCAAYGVNKKNKPLIRYIYILSFYRKYYRTDRYT